MMATGQVAAEICTLTTQRATAVKHAHVCAECRLEKVLTWAYLKNQRSISLSDMYDIGISSPEISEAVSDWLLEKLSEPLVLRHLVLTGDGKREALRGDAPRARGWAGRHVVQRRAVGCSGILLLTESVEHERGEVHARRLAEQQGKPHDERGLPVGHDRPVWCEAIRNSHDGVVQEPVALVHA
eukprot:scaffold169688_cov29-Tisochrysis_lutea.AAC.9